MTGIGIIGLAGIVVKNGILLVDYTNHLRERGMPRDEGDYAPWQFFVLPLCTLVLVEIGGLTRYMRSAMLEVLNQDYIRTAWAKGLNERLVIVRHALRNALIPVVTLIGLTTPASCLSVNSSRADAIPRSTEVDVAPRSRFQP
mgnify:CR=1 FL=1